MNTPSSPPTPPDAPAPLARPRIARPFALAGQNVFLAYLLSDLLPSAIGLLHLNGWYGGLAEPYLACAIARSAGCALVILAVSAGLNRLGFRLQL